MAFLKNTCSFGSVCSQHQVEHKFLISEELLAIKSSKLRLKLLLFLAIIITFYAK